MMDNALASYRVLDLAQGGCVLCGKTLGDLGADVIKVEKPGGDPTRNIGPFYKDIPDPENSLFWFAYNTSKRGITLDIETNDGQVIFKKLTETADFVIESFPPGYLDSLDLGYAALKEINPRLILTSITPFGQGGPKAAYKASDLTVWASGGMLYTMGDPDRPPSWISFPQAALHGAVEGAAGSLVAHWHRERTGRGQHVDVSLQKCAIGTLQAVPEMWEYTRYIYRRAGPRVVSGSGLKRRQFYPCKDGYVAFIILGGSIAGTAVATRALVEWTKEEGMAPDWLVSFDWRADFDIADPQKFPQELIDRIEAAIERFFMGKTKAELYEGALKRGIILTPVSTAKDIWGDRQLRGRDFWQEVEHPELGESLVYCGAFAKLSQTPLGIQRRAPLIGEHNQEVYEKELGFSREKLVLLKQAGVI